MFGILLHLLCGGYGCPRHPQMRVRTGTALLQPCGFCPILSHSTFIDPTLYLKQTKNVIGWSWCMSLIQAFMRQRQVDLWIKTSLVHRASSRMVRAIQKLSQKNKKKGQKNWGVCIQPGALVCCQATEPHFSSKLDGKSLIWVGWSSSQG